MNYLLLYYDKKEKMYLYRIFENLDNAYKFRSLLFATNRVSVVYCYKLFGRSGVNNL